MKKYIKPETKGPRHGPRALERQQLLRRRGRRRIGRIGRPRSIPLPLVEWSGNSRPPGAGGVIRHAPCGLRHAEYKSLFSMFNIKRLIFNIKRSIFNIKTLNVQYQTLNVQYQTLHIQYQIQCLTSNFKLQISNFKLQTSNSKFQISNFKF